MALQDDEKLAFAILYLADALEEPSNAKAHDYLTKARKQANAVIRERNRPEPITPADEPEGDNE